MKVIARPSQSSKTTELIKRAVEIHGYIVVATSVDAGRIASLAWESGVEIHRPITMLEFIRGEYYGAGIGIFLFDDVDRCLEAVTHIPIDTVTITISDQGERRMKVSPTID